MIGQSYQKLEVWKKARSVVKTIYGLTQSFPKTEIYGLTNQMRRAAVSIPSNIAEGKSRHSTKEFIRYLFIARGSAAELETQILISQDLGFLTEKVAQITCSDVSEVGRMLNGLINTLSKDASD